MVCSSCHMSGRKPVRVIRALIHSINWRAQERAASAAYSPSRAERRRTSGSTRRLASASMLPWCARQIRAQTRQRRMGTLSLTQGRSAEQRGPASRRGPAARPARRSPATATTTRPSPSASDAMPPHATPRAATSLHCHCSHRRRATWRGRRSWGVRCPVACAAAATRPPSCF